MTEFSVVPGLASWMISFYLIATIVTQPIAGKFGDFYGHRPVFMTGLLVLSVASFLASFSWSFPSLVLFRVLQGVGGCMVVPTGMAILRRVYPAEGRGAAFGILGGGLSFGAASGPLIGGLIVRFFDWRWIFGINLLVALPGVALAKSLLPPPSRSQGRLSGLDWIGSLALGLAATFLALATTAVRGGSMGLDAMAFSTAFAASLIFFVVWEARVKDPVVHLALFRSRAYSGACASIFLANLTTYATLFLLPILVERLRGASPSTSGMILTAFTGTMVVFSPVGGRLADRWGRKVPAFLGMVLLAAGIVLLALFYEALTPMTIALLLGLSGVGLGVGLPAISATGVESAPASLAGAASGLYATIRHVGGLLGASVLGAVLSSGGERVFFFAFLLLGMSALLGTLTALLLPSRPILSESRA
jgi:EmrB/QacA subfamily drug resistance transporter